MGIPELYLKTENWLQRAGTLLTALRQGFWLGMMDNAALDRLTMLSYNRSEMFTGEEHNFHGLFDWEKRVIDRYFSNCRRLLVGAAGAGREILALTQSTREFDGFECSPGLRERGNELLRARGTPVSIQPAEPGKLPAGLGSGFDGAILGWSAYMHIPGSESRVRLLREMGKHLEPDAPLLTSFLTRLPHRKDAVVARIANGLRALRGVKERVEPGDQLHVYFRHLFTKEEIKTEFETAGFELLFYEDDYYGNAVGKWRG